MIQFWHTRTLCLRQVFQTLWIERDSNSRFLALPASIGRYHANGLRSIIPEAISLEYLLFQFWICATFFLKSVSIRAYLDLNFFFKEKCIFAKKMNCTMCFFYAYRRRRLLEKGGNVNISLSTLLSSNERHTHSLSVSSIYLSCVNGWV